MKIFFYRSAVLFRQPPLSSVKNIYTLPYSISVWISCGILFILIILTLFLELKLNKNRTLDDWNDIFDIITLVLGSICQQGKLN